MHKILIEWKITKIKKSFQIKASYEINLKWETKTKTYVFKE